MSAIATIKGDDIIISARLFLYGSKADAEIAIDIQSEINKMWNQPQVVFPVELKYYRIKFDISTAIISVERAYELLSVNRSHENNFIRIEDKGRIERSMMGFSVGENSGFWVTSDDLGHSTTAAHEFGHALGLSHPLLLDYRGMGNPPLMAPRGTIVDHQFQWNVLADPGTFGGTMRPIYRKVSQEEVLAVAGKMVYVSEGNYIIGKVSNLFFSADGRTSPTQPFSINLV